MIYLPEHLQVKYFELRSSIESTLAKFRAVPPAKYFYELCYCICTPQTSARSAIEVQKALEEIDFKNKNIDPTEILRNPKNYIRFHNQKAKRLIKLKEIIHEIEEILKSDMSNFRKRELINSKVLGFGLKESAHFMRNIGYRGLAILDRHILKHLVQCGVNDRIINVGSSKNYYAVEQEFLKFSDFVQIDIDELDLLFWSYETGEILK